MTKDELINEYFEWMYGLVFDNEYCKRLSYRKLLYFLHDVDFMYTNPMDSNRESDGINLRYRFGEACGHEASIVAAYLDDRPCTVLEMMIALAIRCESQIMDDPIEGNRTGEWFWNMVVSLGLGSMSDGRFNALTVAHIIDNFLRRNYKRNGKGGLFTVEHCPQDMRTAEIWYQMCWYLDEYLNR